MKKYVSLVINPGSTSTKIGVFEDLTLSFEKTIRHSPSELEPFADILDQLDFRTKTIREALAEEAFDLSSLDFIMSRGGVLKPDAGRPAYVYHAPCQQYRGFHRR